jgi:hypothetical protein
MTTGRINQVTISQVRAELNPPHTTPYQPPGRLSEVGIRHEATIFAPTIKCPWIHHKHMSLSEANRTHVKHPATGTPYPQVSQVPGKISLSFARQRSPPSVETTIGRQHLKGAQQPRRISEWLFVDRSSHRQVIHILLHRRLPSQKDRARLMRWRRTWLHTHPAPPIPIQYNPVTQAHQWIGPKGASHPTQGAY